MQNISLHSLINNSALLYTIWQIQNQSKVEEKDHDEDKSEVLGNLVKVVVLIWSASLLTFSYVRLPNGQKILDFDPTFIASVFSGSLAAFGLSPAKQVGSMVNQLRRKKNHLLFLLWNQRNNAKTN